MPENEILSEEVFHQLLAFLRAQRQHARSVIDEQGVRPRDMSVLYLLFEETEVTVSTIQQFIQHSPSTTSTMIANLEKVGFVQRTRSTTDNRVVLVSLTEKGQAVIDDSSLEGLPLLHRELRKLSAERLTTIAGVISELHSMMTREEETS